MKLKLFAIPCILLLAITLIVTSCAKDGPAGATGPAGVAGPQGTAGATGATGATGTANVIYSNWLDVTYDPIDVDSTAWIATIRAPRLDTSILNRGIMKVYWNAGSVDTSLIVALPFTDLLFSGIIITPYFSKDTITLASNFDASTYTDNGQKFFQYRYVLVPGGNTAGRGTNGGTNTTIAGRGTNGGTNTINWNDYKQVKAYLGLKD
jgi:hypothetical protein